MSTSLPSRRGHGEKLSRQWDAAISALLKHARITDAAKAIGVQYGTLRKWLAIPEFAADYQLRRQEALDETVSMLRLASQQAVQTLVRNMRCGLPIAEIAAARVILDSVLKPAGVQVSEGQVPVKIEIVYAPTNQVNIDASTPND